MQVSNQQRHHLSFSCLQRQISAHVETRSQGQSFWGTHVHHVSCPAVLQHVFNIHCRNNLPLSSSLTLLCEFALGPTLKAAAAVTETISHLVTSISYQGNVTGSVHLLTQQEYTTKQLIISAVTEEKGFISGCKSAVIVYQACLFTSAQTRLNILHRLEVNKEIVVEERNRDLLQHFIVNLCPATDNKWLFLSFIFKKCYRCDKLINN